LLLALALWAITATALLLNPSVSHAIDNRIHWRESAENRVFLEGKDAEEFIAYGNERRIECAKPCAVQEDDGTHVSDSRHPSAPASVSPGCTQVRRTSCSAFQHEKAAAEALSINTTVRVVFEA
jgi:hypothetical protein